MANQLGQPAWPASSASQRGQPPWPASFASQLGQPAWPASLASQLGQQAWPACLASKLGEQAWPASLASELGQQRWPANLASQLSQRAWPTTLANKLRQPAQPASLTSQLGQQAWPASLASKLPHARDRRAVGFGQDSALYIWEPEIRTPDEEPRSRIARLNPDTRPERCPWLNPKRAIQTLNAARFHPRCRSPRLRSVTFRLATTQGSDALWGLGRLRRPNPGPRRKTLSASALCAAML